MEVDVANLDIYGPNLILYPQMKGKRSHEVRSLLNQYNETHKCAREYTINGQLDEQRNVIKISFGNVKNCSDGNGICRTRTINQTKLLRFSEKRTSSSQNINIQRFKQKF